MCVNCLSYGFVYFLAYMMLMHVHILLLLSANFLLGISDTAVIDRGRNIICKYHSHPCMHLVVLTFWFSFVHVQIPSHM